MIERIRQAIEYSQLSASAFADTIGISRSGLTHLLTGRNQPSLDVARKILAKYPEISTEWLIMGMGEMLRAEDSDKLPTASSNDKMPVGGHRVENSKFGPQSDLFSEYENSGDPEQDIEEEAVTEKVFQEEESTDEETATVEAPVAEPIPEATVAPSESARAAAVLSRPRRTVSDTRPAPGRRERHTPPSAPAERKLRKIVFFYDDHSFEVYNG